MRLNAKTLQDLVVQTIVACGLRCQGEDVAVGGASGWREGTARAGGANGWGEGWRERVARAGGPRGWRERAVCVAAWIIWWGRTMWASPLGSKQLRSSEDAMLVACGGRGWDDGTGTGRGKQCGWRVRPWWGCRLSESGPRFVTRRCSPAPFPAATG